MTGTIRTTIYGSCVSRDTVEWMRDRIELRDYVARQSLISAVAEPWSNISEVGLTSAFQSRSLLGDLHKSLLPRLAKSAPESDVVLLDLVDERLGVYMQPDGTAATYSFELSRSSVYDTVRSGGHLLRFGTDEHFLAWRRGVWHLKKHLQQLDAWERVLLLAPAWATHDDQGHELPPWRSHEIAAINHMQHRYVDYLDNAGATVVRLAPEDCLANSSHRWGCQPYHYVDSVYDALGAAVLDFSADRGGQVP